MAQGNIDLNVRVRNQRALGKLNNDLNRASKSSMDLGRAAKVAAGALAAIGAAAAIRGIVQTTARFQDLRTSLISVTGSAKAGAEAFDFITDFSTRTQFSVEALTTSFIKLKASGIQPTEELLTTFTDTAAVTTDQIGTLEAITDLFSRTVSGGLGLEELNRLADRGVPVFRILEEQLGITRLQISEFGKTAEGASKITDALTRGINQEFGGATARLLPNLSVAFSNFGIAVSNAADKLGQGFAPELTALTNDLTGLIETNQDLIKSFGKDLGEALTFAVKNIENITLAVAGLTAVLAKNPLVKFVGGVIALKGAVDKLDEAMGEFVVKPLVDLIRGTQEYQDIKIQHDFDQQTASVKSLSKEVSNLATDFDGMNQAQAEYNRQAYEAAQADKERERLLKSIQKVLLDPAAKQYFDAIKADPLIQGLQQAIGEETLLQRQTEILANAFNTFSSTASTQLADVILEAKRLDEALGTIVRTTIRALIEGFINLGITIFVLEPLEKFLRGIKRRQQDINRELKQEIALRTVLAFFGGGGGFGIPFLANGGRAPANQPVVVGERGPELFVPNTAGQVIPNNEINTGGNVEAGGGDNITVTFNINTIDASDFNELLTTRQDLIIGLINRGLAERGKRSLTA